MKAKAVGVSLLIMSGITNAEQFNQLPNSMIMPCKREIPLEPLTRAVIHVLPGRGVNLTFPRELDMDASTTSYTMSSEDVLTFEKAINEANIVPIGFKKFKPDTDIGQVRDFTIATKSHVVSLGLSVDVDPSSHCTNVIFTLTEQERKRLEEEEKKHYKMVLDAQFKERQEALDKEVNEKALLLVTGLAEETPDRWRISEENTLETKKGDQVIGYVRDIQKFGNFYLLSFEIENDSSSIPVYVSDISVRLNNGKKLVGAVKNPKRIEPSKTVEVVYASQDEIPSTSAILALETDQGLLEVSW